MRVERFIAKRYLISKHKINLISVISFISVAGITLGVAALIIVLSVFNGFGSLVTSFLLNMDPHLRIEAKTEKGAKQLSDFETILTGYDEVETFTPFVSGKVLAYRKGLYEVVNLKGIGTERIENLMRLKKITKYGKTDFETGNIVPAGIMGIQLADKLHIITDDTIGIISPAIIEKSILFYSLPNSARLIISGIFISNNNEYDGSYIITSLKSAQNILLTGNQIHGYDVYLKDYEKAAILKENIITRSDTLNFAINTWFDLHRDLYTVMQIERWSAYIILLLIIVVAIFNMLGSLTMTVIEKKRDIGVLQSMGMNGNSITKIFMYEGILIGLAGTILGLLIGLAVCWLQINYNIYPLDPTQYKIDYLPVEIRITDVLWISFTSVLFTISASLLPARRSLKTTPVEAIKWE